MKYKKNIVKLDYSLTKVYRNDRSGVTESERRRGIAIKFGAAAAITILVFMSINGILSVVSSVKNRTSEIDLPASAEAEHPPDFSSRNPLTVLVMKKSDIDKETGKDGVEFCTLIRFDPINEIVAVAPVPADLDVGGTTLRREYAIAQDDLGQTGEWRCADALAKYLGAWEISYTSVNFNQLGRLINKFSGVKFNLKYKVDYKFPGANKNETKQRSILATPGTRVFQGSEIARLMDWPDWPGGDEERSQNYAIIWATMINDHLTPKNSEKLETLHSRISGNSATNVTASDIQHAMEGLQHLCSLNDSHDIAKLVNVFAVKQEDGSYVYEEESLAKMKTVFCG